ncbi:hypothetical protein [Baia soyae]|uniref:Uncharacterized protein n=1 Tax=Baia soyae TaxID=1544746 RepID=A0A4R2S0M4_9BACL|nr:hypothetical protein [Baia soyae]TCP69408.1 hypothetical protein EDD57_10967 [Baia soyae]
MKIIRRYFIPLLVFCLSVTYLLYPHSSVSAQQLQDGVIQDKSVISKYIDLSLPEKRKFEKELPSEIKLKDTGHVVYNQNSGDITAYFNDKHGNSFFGVRFDSKTDKVKDTSSLLFIPKGTNMTNVTITLQGKQTANYMMTGSKVVSGWVFEYGKKADAVGAFERMAQKQKTTSISPQVAPCLKKCMKSAGVPDIVSATITFACGLTCLLPNPACAACLTFQAGVYGGAIFACAQKNCPKNNVSVTGATCSIAS